MNFSCSACTKHWQGCKHLPEDTEYSYISPQYDTDTSWSCQAGKCVSTSVWCSAQRGAIWAQRGGVRPTQRSTHRASWTTCREHKVFSPSEEEAETCEDPTERLAPTRPCFSRVAPTYHTHANTDKVSPFDALAEQETTQSDLLKRNRRAHCQTRLLRSHKLSGQSALNGAEETQRATLCKHKPKWLC